MCSLNFKEEDCVKPEGWRKRQLDTDLGKHCAGWVKNRPQLCLLALQAHASPLDGKRENQLLQANIS